MLPQTWLLSGAFEDLFRSHQLEAHLRREGTVIMEFPEGCRLPAGLGICLLSYLNQLAALGTGLLVLQFAVGGELFGYLDRNGFLSLLSHRIQTHPERPKIPKSLVQYGQAVTLVEIAPLTVTMRVDEMQRIHRGLTDKLAVLLPSTERARRLVTHVRTALAELLQNVPNHSRTALPGFAVLQAYQNAPRPRVEIGVSDSGVGIPASLRSALGTKLGHLTDADLIFRAFGKGLSSTGAHSGRGCGLLRCAQIAAEYGATVSVRTPSAHVALRPNTDHTQDLGKTTWSDVATVAGTHVWIDIRLDP